MASWRDIKFGDVYVNGRGNIIHVKDLVVRVTKRGGVRVTVFWRIKNSSNVDYSIMEYFKMLEFNGYKLLTRKSDREKQRAKRYGD